MRRHSSCTWPPAAVLGASPAGRECSTSKQLAGRCAARPAPAVRRCCCSWPPCTPFLGRRPGCPSQFNGARQLPAGAAMAGPLIVLGRLSAVLAVLPIAQSCGGPRWPRAWGRARARERALAARLAGGKPIMGPSGVGKARGDWAYKKVSGPEEGGGRAAPTCPQRRGAASKNGRRKDSPRQLVAAARSTASATAPGATGEEGGSCACMHLSDDEPPPGASAGVLPYALTHAHTRAHANRRCEHAKKQTT